MAFSGHTCITCAVAFASGELQRAHYKTDWHRYNLKRKVAELAPVKAENFKQKVLSQRAADAKAGERHSHYCEACRKAFASDKSYESHLRSKKHKEKKEVRAPSEVDDGIDDASEGQTDEAIEQTLDTMKNLKIELSAISVEDGNFTEAQTVQVKTLNNTKEKTETTKEVKDSVSKQSKPLIQEDECLSDDSHEGPQPLELDECLFCPHVSEDMERSLKHMSYAHGFFIPDLEYLVDLKGLLEYLCYKVGEERSCLYCNTSRTFYSTEAVQHHMVDKSHYKLFFEGDSALEYAEFYDYTKSYSKPGEEEGKSVEEDGDLPVPDNTLDVNEDLELVLPSGSKLSHRAMRHYYKQRLPTLEQRTSSVVTRLMAQYRAIGWKGAEGEVGKKRVMDETTRLRMQQRRQLKLATKANKQQPHFRPQVVF